MATVKKNNMIRYPDNYYNCMCCGFAVKKLDPTVDGMWDGGIVQEISAGYGSSLDGDKFIIALCDKCVDREAKIGFLKFNGNYMSRNITHYQGLANNDTLDNI
jgi:hypothetical protein